MKCPKCGYISFDYNEVCPKCNKNIAALRDKMSLPSYKAAPLSMLKALTGEASDTDADISVQVSDDTTSVLEEEEGLSLEDSQAIEAMEKTFKDSQEFDMQLETNLTCSWKPRWMKCGMKHLKRMLLIYPWILKTSPLKMLDLSPRRL
jgi:4-hydroxy-3-methylbut-2-en-1-yl diphosphate synthase IspG/GcpE